jgi:D-glycero-D-manno-heptose 1,7-bisphosphate phosphatase
VIKRNLNKLDLVILAGGKGSRISKLTRKKPKPLIKFKNKYFLSYLLNHYSRYPFEKIFILAGYKGEQIYKKFNNKNSNGIEIKCIIEKKTLGTGGALSQLKNRTKNDLIVINGDTFIDCNLEDFFLKKKKYNFIFLTKNKNYLSNNILANLNINKKSFIKFDGKLMNAGVYFLKQNILKKISKKNISLENDILSNLIQKKSIKGKISKSNFIDIGTYKNINLVKSNFHKQFERPAAFLDRDGVINHDYGYVNKVKDFDLKPNVIKGLKYLNKKNYNIFIVTNQSGIARGFFTEKDYLKFYKLIKNIFFKRKCYINDMQYCPYMKGAVVKKYDKMTKLRKPGNLMILNLMKKWFINKRQSFMIGDQLTDKLAANKSKLFFEYSSNNFYNQVKKIVFQLNKK